MPLTIAGHAERKAGPAHLSRRRCRTPRAVYQLGVWLRDSMAGIGTMTFYDPDSGVFAALGHGINDVDTATLMPHGVRAASCTAAVSDVQKGVSGRSPESSTGSLT